MDILKSSLAGNVLNNILYGMSPVQMRRNTCISYYLVRLWFLKCFKISTETNQISRQCTANFNSILLNWPKQGPFSCFPTMTVSVFRTKKNISSMTSAVWCHPLVEMWGSFLDIHAWTSYSLSFNSLLGLYLVTTANLNKIFVNDLHKKWSFQ